MEKDTDSLRPKSTLKIDGLLPHQEEVVSLYEAGIDDNDSNKKTVAYARLGEEALEMLAVIGEAPFVSIVKDSLEYKLADFEDDLDDPLRDLDSPTGTTKYFLMMEELGKLGFDIYRELTQEEEADLVRYLDDFEHDSLPGESSPESVNKFVIKAVDFGISRNKLAKLFNLAKNRNGVLIGLSEEFLKDAGEDIWPDNHPCRYAKLDGGLLIKYITKIVPLDNTSKEILEYLKKQVETYADCSSVQVTIEAPLNTTRKSVEDLGLLT